MLELLTFFVTISGTVFFAYCVWDGVFRASDLLDRSKAMHAETLEVLAATRHANAAAVGLCKRMARMLEYSRHAPELLDDAYFHALGFGPKSAASEQLEPGREAQAELLLQPMKHAERSSTVSPTTENAAQVLASTVNDKSAGSLFGVLQ